MRHLITFAITVTVAACGSSDLRPDSAKLAASQPQCDFVNYYRVEALNVLGPGRCRTDCDCDGIRSCMAGMCRGLARPTDASHCNDPSYRWNEAWNTGGAGVCTSDCECNGTRTCASGHCQDGSRVAR
jgi:hypothetical protein